MDPSAAAAAGVAIRRTAGALLLITTTIIGAVLLLIGADLIDTVEGGMTGIGITAGAATMIVGAIDLRTM